MVFHGIFAAQLIGIEIQPGSPNQQLSPDIISFTPFVISSIVSSISQRPMLI